MKDGSQIRMMGVATRNGFDDATETCGDGETGCKPSRVHHKTFGEEVRARPCKSWLSRVNRQVLSYRLRRLSSFLFPRERSPATLNPTFSANLHPVRHLPRVEMEERHTRFGR